MSYKVYKSQNYFVVHDNATGVDVIRQVRSLVRWEKKGTLYSFYYNTPNLTTSGNAIVRLGSVYEFSDLVDSTGSAWVSQDVLDLYLEKWTGYICCETNVDNLITVNGTDDFTINACDSLDIVLSDGASSVTPVSVTPNAGLNKVDIVLPTSGTPVDSDAQRFIDATAITDTIIQNAIDVAVVALKDNGLWSRIYAWYPFVGGSASTHKFNVKDSRDTDDALRLTFFGGITHDANGITGNGSTGYADTHFNMLSGGIYRENFGMSQYVRNSGWSGYAHGITDSSSFIGMYRSGTDLYYFVYGDTSVVGTVATATKLLTQQRSASNLTTLYRSGSSVATSTGTTQAFINQTMYLLGRNTLGSALGLSTANLASTLIHKAFSDAEVATLNTIIETFETSLSRNV